MKVKISGQTCEEKQDLYSLKAYINYKGKNRDFPVEKLANITLTKSRSVSSVIKTYQHH